MKAKPIKIFEFKILEVRQARNLMLRNYKKYLGHEYSDEEYEALAAALGCRRLTIFNLSSVTMELLETMNKLNGPYGHAMFKVLFARNRHKI